MIRRLFDPSLKTRTRLRHYADFLLDHSLFRVQRRIFRIWADQEAHWDKPIYWAGWLYQSMPALHLSGWRDTRARIALYQLGQQLSADSRVLDIGANCGFIPLSLASQGGHWVCVEPNPYLCQIGEAVAEHLGLGNVEFRAHGFEELRGEEPFDLICSFASHATYDGNSKLALDEFLDRVDGLLKPGGFFAFESHNGETDNAELYGALVCAISKRFRIERQLAYLSPEHTLAYQSNTGAIRHFVGARKPLSSGGAE